MPKSRDRRGRKHTLNAHVARTAIPPIARFLFDPLEPRILMNADVLTVQLATLPADAQPRDILLQAVQEAIDIAGQTAMVERVRILDMDRDGAVLAVADRADLDRIDITGDPDGTRVSVDVDSFGTHGAPDIMIAGAEAAASNTLVALHGSALDWQVKGDGSGVITGPTGISIGFSGIGTVVGGAGDDTLHGPAADTQWTVTSTGAGVAGTTRFTGFERLAGAADNNDSFEFAPGAVLARGVDGGAGGYDTVTVRGNHVGSAELIAVDASSGRLILDGSAIVYTGMEPAWVVSQTSANVTITLAGGSGAITLGKSGTDALVLSAPGIAETQFFSAPTDHLTINLPTGGGSTLTINDLGAQFNAGLTVNAGGGGDVVTILAPVNSDGGAVSITADTISVGAGGTINTGRAGAASGAITLSGRAISITDGALLSTQAVGIGGTAGAIVLSVADTDYRTTSALGAFVPRSVSVSLDGATVAGGDIRILARAEDLAKANEVLAITNAYHGALGSLLPLIPGGLAATGSGSFAGIDATVGRRGADAAITLNDATLSSSGFIDIHALTNAAVRLNAIGMDYATGVPISAAAAVGRASSTVSVTLDGASSVTAAGNVDIAARGSVAVAALSVADGSAASATAVAIGHTDLNDTVTVGSGATITSTGASVNIQATGAASNATTATTTAGADGIAGRAASLGFDVATVQARIDGKITAAATLGAPSSASVARFNGADGGVVNDATNSFHMVGHGLTTGQALTYDSGLGLGGLAQAEIGGLVDGRTYYALVTDADNFQLTRAPVLDFDPSGTNASASHTLTPVRSVTFSLDAITNKTITLAGHGFADGEVVVYDRQGNTAIDGLTSGQSYVVERINDSDFRLLSGDAVVNVRQQVAIGAHRFTSQATGVARELVLAYVDSLNILHLADHGVANGQRVEYAPAQAGGVNPIKGGVAAGGTYVANVLTADTFELKFEESDAFAVTLQAPDGPGLHSFAWLGDAIAFAPGSASDIDGRIALNPGALLTGDAVIYHAGPAGGAIDAPIGGLVNGGVYTVVLADPSHIRLVGDPAHAAWAAPIDIGAVGKGVQSLSGPAPTIGVGIAATLTDTITTTAEPSHPSHIDGHTAEDLIAARTSVLLPPLVSLAGLFGNARTVDAQTPAANGSGSTVGSKPVSGAGVLADAASVAFSLTKHDVRALVGTAAPDLTHRSLTSGGDVDITATIVERSRSSAITSGRSAIAISESIHDNIAMAEIGDFARVDAGKGMRVAATVAYPFLLDIDSAKLSALADTSSGASLAADGTGVISGALAATLGLSPGFLNSRASGLGPARPWMTRLGRGRSSSMPTPTPSRRRSRMAR